MTKGKGYRYPQEFKEQIYELHKAGQSVPRLSSEYGIPTDNPVLESLNGWIKVELSLDFNLKNAKDVHKLIKEYVKYYNQNRLACALQYKNPIQCRTELGFN